MSAEVDQPAEIVVPGDGSESDEEDFVYANERPPEPTVEVSSVIAIIRIVAVLGMGLCLSFGLFISLVGVTGIIIGVPIMLLAIPCYFGMQVAEKLAGGTGRSDATADVREP